MGLRKGGQTEVRESPCTLSTLCDPGVKICPSPSLFLKQP